MLTRFGKNPAEVARSSQRGFQAPLTWRNPARVFTCSFSDFFAQEADPWRNEAWDIIRRTPHLMYLILTKRPERIVDHLPAGWPWPNVALGVTAETSEWYGIRWWTLVQIPAAFRFVSVEPMLDGVTIEPLQGVVPDWLIAGCESGPNRRRTLDIWVQRLIRSCQSQRLPLFIKQLSQGGRLVKMPDVNGQVWDQMPPLIEQWGRGRMSA
jgi:protein gp37